MIFVIVYVESQGDYRESIFEFKTFEGNEGFLKKQTADVIIGREKPFTIIEKEVERVSITNE